MSYFSLTVGWNCLLRKYCINQNRYDFAPFYPLLRSYKRKRCETKKHLIWKTNNVVNHGKDGLYIVGKYEIPKNLLDQFLNLIMMYFVHEKVLT